MATTTIQVRTSPALKAACEATLSSMGLTMSAAINMFCRQVVNQGRIPFDIVSGPELNETTRQALDDAMAGRNLSRKFATVDEMWADLDA